jgi:hypothetical protein
MAVATVPPSATVAAVAPVVSNVRIVLTPPAGEQPTRTVSVTQTDAVDGDDSDGLFYLVLSGYYTTAPGGRHTPMG